MGRLFLGLVAVLALAIGGAVYYVFFSTKTINGLTGPAVDLFIDFQVLGETNLNEEGVAPLAGRNLRTRYWTIPSGSIVPVHEHSNRPVTIYTIQGEIYEYRNDRKDPVRHAAGGLSLEEGYNLAHWWRNEGPQDVLLVAFDIYQVADDVTNPGPVSAAPTAADAAVLPETQGAEQELLGYVDLAKHFQGRFGEGHALLTYRVTVQPGGVFPMPTRAGEPLHLFVERGEVTENRAGEAARTLAQGAGSQVHGGAVAFWTNTGSAPASLIIGTLEALAGRTLPAQPLHREG